MQVKELVAFGQAVREHRRHLALSQEDLAELSDLHRTYISGVENGQRNVGLLNVYRLASALGLSAPQLLATAETYRKRGGRPARQ